MYVIFITQTAFRPGPHCLRTSPAFSEPWPIPRYGTVKYGKHSISYLGPYLWGEISQDISSRLALVRLWELCAILMCQACWMVRATAVRVHNVYSIVIDIITLIFFFRMCIYC